MPSGSDRLELGQRVTDAPRGGERLGARLLDDPQRDRFEPWKRARPRRKPGASRISARSPSWTRPCAVCTGTRRSSSGLAASVATETQPELVAHLEQAGAARRARFLRAPRTPARASRRRAAVRSGTRLIWSCRSSPPGARCAPRRGSTAGGERAPAWRGPEDHRVDRRAFEHQLLDLLEPARGAGQQRRFGALGKLAEKRGDLLADQLARAPWIGAAFERDHDLGDAGCRVEVTRRTPGRPEERLLDGLCDGELDLRRRAAGALDQELQGRQREVREEVARSCPYTK